MILECLQGNNLIFIIFRLLVGVFFCTLLVKLVNGMLIGKDGINETLTWIK